ncbi:MAG: hypothetical protein JSS02_30680 [Planctomycetes bacterium]|nr:hypothetical protein [Planctomycetota bacterium]
MFDSPVVSIGIGLVLTYLFLGLVVSAANELIATILRSRATILERGIRNLLDGTTHFPASWWSGWLSKSAHAPAKPGVWSQSFFKHQLINALAADDSKPSYISASAFASVLMHLVQRSASEFDRLIVEKVPDAAPALQSAHQARVAANIATREHVRAPTELLKTTFETAIDKLTKANQAADSLRTMLAPHIQALLQARQAQGNEQDLIPDGPTLSGNISFEGIRETIEKIDNPRIQQALLSLLEVARADVTQGVTDLQKFQTQIENWFNHAMDRVSGWYARRTRLVSLALAVGIIAILNVDTVRICRALGNDSTLRAAVVKAAENYVDAEHPPEEGGTTPPVDASVLNTQITHVRESVNDLAGLGIPLGWNQHDYLVHSYQAEKRDQAEFVGSILAKLAGLSLTVFAASLGAPFWFDVLNKFISIRGNGKSPEEMDRQRKTN